MSKVEGTGGAREINRTHRLKQEEQGKANKTLFNFGDENSDGKVHTVARGETAFAIARKYNITIYQLAEANGWQVIKNKGNIVLKKNDRKIRRQPYENCR